MSQTKSPHGPANHPTKHPGFFGATGRQEQETFRKGYEISAQKRAHCEQWRSIWEKDSMADVPWSLNITEVTPGLGIPEYLVHKIHLQDFEWQKPKAQPNLQRGTSLTRSQNSPGDPGMSLGCPKSSPLSNQPQKPPAPSDPAAERQSSPCL